MFGNWICATPMEIAGKMRTTCARLLPKEDSRGDPRFVLDQQIDVSTYFTSRFTGRVPPPTAVNSNASLIANNNLGFTNDSINIMDSVGFVFNGAVSTTASGLVGLVAAVAALSF
jgi:hypothetical protein